MAVLDGSSLPWASRCICILFSGQWLFLIVQFITSHNGETQHTCTLYGYATFHHIQFAWCAVSELELCTDYRDSTYLYEIYNIRVYVHVPSVMFVCVYFCLDWLLFANEVVAFSVRYTSAVYIWRYVYVCCGRARLCIPYNATISFALRILMPIWIACKPIANLSAHIVIFPYIYV